VPSYIAELLGVQDFFFQMPESERVFGSWNREPNLSGFVNWAFIYFFVQLFSFSSHVCQYKYQLLSFMFLCRLPKFCFATTLQLHRYPFSSSQRNMTKGIAQEE
jgi:hypothetical protein